MTSTLRETALLPRRPATPLTHSKTKLPGSLYKNYLKFQDSRAWHQAWSLLSSRPCVQLHRSQSPKAGPGCPVSLRYRLPYCWLLYHWQQGRWAKKTEMNLIYQKTDTTAERAIRCGLEGCGMGHHQQLLQPAFNLLLSPLPF